ncbi:MAG: Ldh family oxidoreductase [Cytophagales bacterium]|nr:Ldh family oxidoreductase [Cytophagales bacterium]
MDKLIQAKPLTDIVARIIKGTGSSDAEALQVAENLVLANLSGHDSHGVGMVPRYVDAVLEGGLFPNTSVKVNLDSGALLGLDGQRGYGQIVGVEATRMGIERAKKHGSCIVALGHAHHLGRIGHFAEMAVAEGLVSIHFVNVLARPVVAAWGGGDGRYGTNPCCIGVPIGVDSRLRGNDKSGGNNKSGGLDKSGGLGKSGGLDKYREPFILDFATSRVAQGKMRVAYNKGERVPDGYLIDERGAPTNNPGVVVVSQNPDPNGEVKLGALMPFGEHKGFGMAVACELLGGALCGGGTWHRPADNARAVYNSMLTILVSPESLGTQNIFAQEASSFIDWLKQSPAAQGSGGVLTAGDPERTYRARRSVDGIVVDSTTWGELMVAGKKVGVEVAA